MAEAVLGKSNLARVLGCDLKYYDWLEYWIRIIGYVCPYIHTGPRQQLELDSTILVSVITILFRGGPTASPDLSLSQCKKNWGSNS